MLNRDNVPEFIGQIIDIFEDFLEDRNIELHNSEREQSGADAAIIYGTDYGQLQSHIEETLNNWGLINAINDGMEYPVEERERATKGAFWYE